MNSMFLNAAAAASLLFERVRKRRAGMVRSLSVVMLFMIACLLSAASTCLAESVIIILKVNIRVVTQCQCLSYRGLQALFRLLFVWVILFILFESVCIAHCF